MDKVSKLEIYIKEEGPLTYPYIGGMLDEGNDFFGGIMCGWFKVNERHSS